MLKKHDTHVRPYRGRELCARLHYIYRNLNNECWSVRAIDGRFAGKVVAHADSISLRDAEFRVNQSGRDRVLASGRKNVHAGVVGTLAPSTWIHTRRYLDTQIRYNPYRFGMFTTDAFEPVLRATHVHFGIDGRVHAGGVQRA